jgi:glycolate oxidase iron-sulfur subunit
MSAAAGTTHIAALADQCVKCGLCLPHCPTYRVGRSEAESPRGRIAFAQARARGDLEPTPTLIAHIDNCLACMSCEPVCPSHVRYADLIVATRALLRDATPAPRGRRVLGRLLARPRLLLAGLRLANLPIVRQCIQSRTLQPLWRLLGLDRLVRELPHLPRAMRLQPAKPEAARGSVGLFLGCVASAVDRDVHAGAIRLLSALGYTVVLPRGQGCCGALALHAGDPARANALAAKLREAFADSSVDTVLVSASGCFGTVRDHVFAGSAVRVREIHEFLDSDARMDQLRFRPLGHSVGLHAPCTQANVARAGAAIQRLLSKIPQMEIVPLPAEPRCCGAAGDYFLMHAEIADTLRGEKVEQILAARPDLLVTSNVGCRMFLDNGLRQCGAKVPVTHPIVLLAQQLEN